MNFGNPTCRETRLKFSVFNDLVSFGRVVAASSHGGGHWFESPQLHHLTPLFPNTYTEEEIQD